MKLTDKKIVEYDDIKIIILIYDSGKHANATIVPKTEKGKEIINNFISPNEITSN